MTNPIHLRALVKSCGANLFHVVAPILFSAELFLSCLNRKRSKLLAECWCVHARQYSTDARGAIHTLPARQCRAKVLSTFPADASPWLSSRLVLRTHAHHLLGPRNVRVRRLDRPLAAGAPAEFGTAYLRCTASFDNSPLVLPVYKPPALHGVPAPRNFRQFEGVDLV